MPKEQNGVISYSAKWDGEVLILKKGFGGTTPFGPATTAARQVWALSADKQILTIATSSDDFGEELMVTQVYKRQQ